MKSNQQKLTSLAVFCITVLAIVTSCDKKVGSPNTTQTTTTGTTTTTTGGTVATGCDTVTFAKHINAIINTKCGSTPGCHTGAAPSGGLLLSSYDNVKAQGVLGRIKARSIDANPSSMPPDGSTPLTTLEKSQINCWLGNGYK